jgi:hypothetical protein
MFTMLVIMALLTTAMTGPLLRWCLPQELRPPNHETTDAPGANTPAPKPS